MLITLEPVQSGVNSQVIGEHLQWGMDEGGPRQKVHTMRQRGPQNRNSVRRTRRRLGQGDDTKLEISISLMLMLL